MRTTLVIPVAALAITLSLAGCSLQPTVGGSGDSGSTGSTQPGTVGVVTGGATATPAPSTAIDPAEDGGSGVPTDGSRASVIEIATDELRAYYGAAGLNSDRTRTRLLRGPERGCRRSHPGVRRGADDDRVPRPPGRRRRYRVLMGRLRPLRGIDRAGLRIRV